MRLPTSRPGRTRALVAALALAALAGFPGGCSPGEEPEGVVAAAGAAAPAIELLETPAPSGALAPELSLIGGAPALSWLERSGDGPGAWRLRLARWRTGAGPEGFGAPVTVTPAAGETELFANWADRPGVVEGGPPAGRGSEEPEGPLYAWWLAKTGTGTYAYGVELARSGDGGTTWQPLGPLHDDRSATEHGFVSLVPEGDGVRALWLDGRATARGEPMTLRTVRIGEGVERATEEVVDGSVCDCCETAAVATAGGPLVAYRDRAAGEVRDVWAVRRSAEGWSEPRPVHRDGWEIPACPVNGPALARHASGETETVWVAWFTAALGAPRVLAAVSDDGGRSFGEPVAVDDEGALGRVDLAVDAERGEAVVSWLDADGEGQAAVRLRRLGRDGRLGPVLDLARAESSRASGVPRLLAYPSAGGERLLVAWVEPEAGAREGAIRLATLPIAAVPAR
jgi:hypothetical protein